MYKPLAKSVLIPLELSASASATDAAIFKEMSVSGTTILIILNEEINGNSKIKTVKSLEELGLLIKKLTKQK